jgi:hypothetical protein
LCCFPSLYGAGLLFFERFLSLFDTIPLYLVVLLSLAHMLCYLVSTAHQRFNLACLDAAELDNWTAVISTNIRSIVALCTVFLPSFRSGEGKKTK